MWQALKHIEEQAWALCERSNVAATIHTENSIISMAKKERVSNKLEFANLGLYRTYKAVSVAKSETKSSTKHSERPSKCSNQLIITSLFITLLLII